MRRSVILLVATTVVALLGLAPRPVEAVPGYQGYYPGSGAIRMVVDEKEAEVYVDGYYAGIVDDFDGTFQKLYLQPGEHEIEFRLEGYRTFTQRVLVNPSHTQKLHHQMVPLVQGETEATPRTPSSAEQTEPLPTASPEPAPPLPEPTETPPTPTPSLTAATPGEFGVLRLHVQPAEGMIQIDGEPWGTLGGMEVMSIHLPAGTHRIELLRGDTSVFGTDVEIGRGETTPLNILLPR